MFYKISVCFDSDKCWTFFLSFVLGFILLTFCQVTYVIFLFYVCLLCLLDDDLLSTINLLQMHSLEHKQISSRSVVPPLSPKYPWFVAQNLEAEEDDTQPHTFFNLNDPLSHYRCKIPELLGKRIRGCFFGCWALLSSNRDVTWSLWNPITCEIINLPPLNHRGSEGDYDDIRYCCLSAPPDHPNSVLLLTRTRKRNLVYCRLGSYSFFRNTRKKMELRWTEMTYVKQIRSITGFNDGYLYSLTCCKW